MHEILQVFLGLYVDAFHMASKETGMQSAWDALRKSITSGEITNIEGNTYLGNS